MHEHPIGNLENELTSCLVPLRAPECMWERVEAGLERRKSRTRLIARAALGLPIAIALGAFWSVRGPVPPLEAEALEAHREFLRHPERLDLRQANPAALCNWVGEHSTLGLRLATRPRPDPDSISFEGARILRGGRAAVFYRIGPYSATLLIAPASDRTSPKCIVNRREPRQGLKLFSWEARGQAFALVSSVPGNSQAACFVCHVEPQRRQGILQMKFAASSGGA